MNGDKRKMLDRARKLLELGETASLDEIRRAYRRLAKQCHPDTGRTAEGRPAATARMQELTAAYQVLLAYGNSYPLPLVPDEDRPPDPEEWWFEQFGEDPVWGRSRR